MGVRDSFSRLKEELKHRSTGRRRKPDGTVSGTDGEGLDPTGSLLWPVPYVAVGGHDGGGGRSNTDIDGAEVNQRDSHLYTGVEVAMGNVSSRGDGAGEEGDQTHSRSSTPSTPRSGNPEGV